jgi:hypothetical protein
VRLIVLHTAEGATTIESLGSFFSNSASGVSSHTGIDDKAGVIGEYVRPDYKAWTASNANPVAVQTELCAFARWTAAEWAGHPNMLSNAAAWVAEESARFGIPIIKLTPQQAQGGGTGVCQHRDLGTWGGNHSDCGNGFPIDQVLAMATGGVSSPAPGPVPPTPTPVGGPPWPGVYLRDFTNDPSARTWQQQMANRGWTIGVDGQYGPQSAGVCRSFQQEKGLGVDGVVGPQTWAASWNMPVT